jgi:hypothetical protein
VKKGVKKCTNHEPKVRLGRMVLVMPPSERQAIKRALGRMRGSTRVPGGAFGKNGRLRVPFDPRPCLPPEEISRLARRWSRP